MRLVSEEGLRLIKHYEGFSPVLYHCPGGYLTIGYGHLVKKGETARFQAGVGEAEASILLMQDLRSTVQALERMVYVGLTDGQFDALVSFTFNLGAGAFQRSSLRQKVNRQEHMDAVFEFSKWVWAGGIRQKGLVRRRAAEALLYKQ